MKKHNLETTLRFIGRHELGTILTLLVVAAGSLLFVAVADEVSEGEAQKYDRLVLIALRGKDVSASPFGEEWVVELFRDLTALGGSAVLTMLTAAVIGHFLLLRRPHAAAFVGVSVSGALGLSLLLKTLFNRPRPDLLPHLSYALTSSFPSGHSMLSTAVYLTLAALLARLQEDLVYKAYVLLWALFLSFLVGISRIYVGVHWPSDVLAGWGAGAAWAALCWLLARLAQRRGLVELPRAGQSARPMRDRGERPAVS